MFVFNQPINRLMPPLNLCFPSAHRQFHFFFVWLQTSTARGYFILLSEYISSITRHVLGIIRIYAPSQSTHISQSTHLHNLHTFHNIHTFTIYTPSQYTHLHNIYAFTETYNKFILVICEQHGTEYKLITKANYHFFARRLIRRQTTNVHLVRLPPLAHCQKIHFGLHIDVSTENSFRSTYRCIDRKWRLLIRCVFTASPESLLYADAASYRREKIPDANKIALWYFTLLYSWNDISYIMLWK